MRLLAWGAASIGIGLGAMSAFVYSGIFNVSALEHHWPVTEKFISVARDRSIRVHAASIIVPPNLENHDMVVQGVQHYRAHCAVCHGGPGREPDDMAHGMYPTPPNLQKTAGLRTPAELFWIVRNGIKMSAMPSWADHGDSEIWPVVAFLMTLPAMNSEDYARLGSEADRLDGGRHGHHPDAPMDGPSSSPQTTDTIQHHHHHDH